MGMKFFNLIVNSLNSLFFGCLIFIIFSDWNVVLTGKRIIIYICDCLRSLIWLTAMLLNNHCTLIHVAVNFCCPFVLNSLAYITIPKNHGKMKINWNKKLTTTYTCIAWTSIYLFCFAVFPQDIKWLSQFSFAAVNLIFYVYLGLNAFYCPNSLHVGLSILCIKMRTFLCRESTVAA